MQDVLEDAGQVSGDEPATLWGFPLRTRPGAPALTRRPTSVEPRDACSGTPEHQGVCRWIIGDQRDVPSGQLDGLGEGQACEGGGGIRSVRREAYLDPVGPRGKGDLVQHVDRPVLPGSRRAHQILAPMYSSHHHEEKKIARQQGDPR